MNGSKPPLFRLVARYEPRHPRLAGTRTNSLARRGQSPVVVPRGAWRVVACFEANPAAPLVFTDSHELYAVSPRRLAKGWLCNPAALLREALVMRRASPSLPG